MTLIDTVMHFNAVSEGEAVFTWALAVCEHPFL